MTTRTCSSQCGTEAPALEGDLDGATVVEMPVESIFSESTSHYGFIDVLDLEGTVTGVGDGSLVVTPSLAERAAAGEVESFTPNFTDRHRDGRRRRSRRLRHRRLRRPGHEVIRAAGIPVVANAEWLETTPEGWAEWVGLFAALTNTEARANELYAEWIADYDAAAALVADVTERPTVLTGGLFEGTWYASGGAGIVAEFIADAGGDYVYDDDPSTARSSSTSRPCSPTAPTPTSGCSRRRSPPRRKPWPPTRATPSSPPGTRWRVDQQRPARPGGQLPRAGSGDDRRVPARLHHDPAPRGRCPTTSWCSSQVPES